MSPRPEKPYFFFCCFFCFSFVCLSFSFSFIFALFFCLFAFLFLGDFIQGEVGPPLPREGEPRTPVLTAEGLTIQAEDFRFEGEVFDDEMKGAEAYYVARAGEAGGRVHVDLRVVDEFNLRGGVILTPLGKFNLVHDSPVNDLTDRCPNTAPGQAV